MERKKKNGKFYDERFGAGCEAPLKTEKENLELKTTERKLETLRKENRKLKRKQLKEEA